MGNHTDFKYIRAKKRPTLKGFREASRETRQASGEIVKRKLEATVKTWGAKTKPTFEIRLLPGDVVRVQTDSRIFHILDMGSDPHLIQAKNAKALSFQWGGYGSYQAKSMPYVSITQPSSLRAYVGMAGSKVTKKQKGEYREFQHVWHPGFPARKFWIQVQDRLGPEIYKAMNRALDKYFK